MEVLLEIIRFRRQWRQQVTRWKFNHLLTMNKIMTIVKMDADKINVNSQSVTDVFIINWSVLSYNWKSRISIERISFFVFLRVMLLVLVSILWLMIEMKQPYDVYLVFSFLTSSILQCVLSLSLSSSVLLFFAVFSTGNDEVNRLRAF